MYADPNMAELVNKASTRNVPCYLKRDRNEPVIYANTEQLHFIDQHPQIKQKTLNKYILDSHLIKLIIIYILSSILNLICH